MCVRARGHRVDVQSIDMLRKLTLVGLVVLAGRGSVAQNMCSSIVSFFFFALHIKMWPMKMTEDNILRATCEFHVFWTITTAFVMKSDLSHERLEEAFYDDALLITGVLFVPVTFIWAMYSKWKRYKEVPSADVSTPGGIPGTEFVRFSIGLASSNDRDKLKEYFEKRSKHYQVAETFDDENVATKEQSNGRTVYVLDVNCKLKTLLEKLVALAPDEIEEPALTNLQELQKCQTELIETAKLENHLVSSDMDDSEKRRVSVIRRTHVDYLEFIEWWLQRLTKTHEVQEPDFLAQMDSERKKILLQFVNQIARDYPQPTQQQKDLIEMKFELNWDQVDQLICFAQQKLREKQQERFSTMKEAEKRRISAGFCIAVWHVCCCRSKGSKASNAPDVSTPLFAGVTLDAMQLDPSDQLH